jgi:hypothetical protein
MAGHTTEFRSWHTFYATFNWRMPDLNQIVDYFFEAAPSERTPHSATLNLWVLYPRKCASRAIVVHGVNDQDASQVEEVLSAARKRLSRRFRSFT